MTLKAIATQLVKQKEDKRDRDELVAIATQIAQHQKATELNDTEFVRKFSGLGSTKTYKRILKADTPLETTKEPDRLADLNIDRWLIEFRQVLALIQALGKAESEEEPLYDDLSPCMRLRAAVTDAMREKGNNRLVIMSGPSGSGKSHANMALARKYGSHIILAEADETWKNSIGNMLRGLLVAHGMRYDDVPFEVGARLARLLAIRREKTNCLVIDEGHHLGPRTLNLVKTLLNQTPGQLVLSAIGTLLRNLERTAYEEARQLTGNRLCERITLDFINPDDVLTFIGRRLNWASKADMEQAAEAVEEKANTYGQFAFLKTVCRRARRKAGDEPVTLDGFTKAVAAAINAR